MGFIDKDGVSVAWERTKNWVRSLIASDTQAGMVKTDTANGITLNTDGALEVTGRMGQYPNGGIYYDVDMDPRAVGKYSFLVTDTKGMYMGGEKTLGLVSGAPLQLNVQHQAGTTEYTVANTYTNRIVCKCAENGFASLALGGETVSITSVRINGRAFTPDSSPDDPNNSIVITLEKSVNPDTATSRIYLYARMIGNANLFVGQNVASQGGLYSSIVGSTLLNTKNFCTIGGYMNINTGNSCTLLGRQHLNNVGTKNNVTLLGCGHDNAQGIAGVTAVGLYSNIDANTLFAVGNGTSHTTRSNAFEVRKDGTATVAVLKSPDGTSWKISVANDGTLTTAAL